MSENKCPCCGDTISIFTDSGFYECDSCPFMCALEDFPNIAAAMKAETRHNALAEAVRGLLGSLDNGEFKTTITHSVAAEMAEKVYRINRAEVERMIAEGR